MGRILAGTVYARVVLWWLDAIFMVDGGLQPGALAPTTVLLLQCAPPPKLLHAAGWGSGNCCPETPEYLPALMTIELPCLGPTGRSLTEEELLNGWLPPPGYGQRATGPVHSLSVTVAC